MDEVVGEQVAVRTHASGAPVLVEWRGRRYRVVGRPVRWVDRSPWWRWTAARLRAVVEQPMWTVDLAAGTDDAIEVDLSVTAGDWWRLERVRG